MADEAPGAAREWPGRAEGQTDNAVLESKRRILCRVCHSGDLKLYMCGPRLRGRCRSCGTVWVFLWSCTKQGWFQWSN